MEDPYNALCAADGAQNWEMNYDRKLIRDIKAISGIVMVLSVSAVSDELVFESQPTDTTIHKHVREHCDFL